jgi:TetR/AcrR family fatty acid metabolism transcriptional regulator
VIEAAAQAKKLDKRRHILEAAVVVFARTGFHKSRVSDVAREADVADGTIYLYFKGKDDILISIFEETMSEMIERAQAVVAGEGDPLDRLHRFAIKHMENVETHMPVAKVLLVELRLSHTFMTEYKPTRLQTYLDIIGALIIEGQESGVVRADINPTIARRAFFGALDEIAMQWILTPNARYGLRESAEQIADVFVRGLRA